MLSWALYDFANTVFSMNIATLYFAAWLVGDLGHSNTLYATVNGIASALVVVSIPVFGAISDATQRRKPWVVGFTLIACVSTVLMAILGQTGLPLVGEGVTARLRAQLCLPVLRYSECSQRLRSRTTLIKAHNRSTMRCCRSSSRWIIEGACRDGRCIRLHRLDNRCLADLPFFHRLLP